MWRVSCFWNSFQPIERSCEGQEKKIRSAAQADQWLRALSAFTQTSSGRADAHQECSARSPAAFQDAIMRTSLHAATPEACRPSSQRVEEPPAPPQKPSRCECVCFAMHTSPVAAIGPLRPSCQAQRWYRPLLARPCMCRLSPTADRVDFHDVASICSVVRARALPDCRRCWATHREVSFPLPARFRFKLLRWPLRAVKAPAAVARRSNPRLRF